VGTFRIWLVGSGLLVRVGDPDDVNRDLGLPNDVFGHASEQESVHARPTVRPHHDHVYFLVGGIRDDLVLGHTLFDRGGGRDARDFGLLGDRSDGCFIRGFERILESDPLRIWDRAVVAVVDDVECVDDPAV
jgi:hypothetical protein